MNILRRELLNFKAGPDKDFLRRRKKMCRNKAESKIKPFILCTVVSEVFIFGSSLYNNEGEESTPARGKLSDKQPLRETLPPSQNFFGTVPENPLRSINSLTRIMLNGPRLECSLF